jgi:hypothetical protein
VAVAGGNIYWINSVQGKINKMAADLRTSPSEVAFPMNPYSLASSPAQAVFWTDGNTVNGTTLHSPLVRPTGENPSVIEVDGVGNAYWIGAAAGLFRWSSGSVTTLDTFDAINRFAVYGPSIYFDDGGSDVQMLSINGGSPSPVSAVEMTANSIAADSSGVYWANLAQGGCASPGASQGAIRKAALDGSNVITLMTTNVLCPDGIALDAANVYWVQADVSGSGYSIMKLAKSK